MSEYIISTTNMPEHVRETLNAWCDVSGEIVRCRDCERMIHFWHHDDERWQCMNEMLEGLDVSPGFFCAWGERRADS